MFELAAQEGGADAYVGAGAESAALALPVRHKIPIDVIGLLMRVCHNKTSYQLRIG